MAKSPSKAVTKADHDERADSTKAASKRAIRRIGERVAAGEERLALNIRSDGPNSSMREAIHGMSSQEMELRLIDAFGTTSTEFVDEMSSLLMTVFNSGNDRRATREINAALAVLDGVKPDNEVEAMLLTQMVATNHAAMTCLAQIGQPIGAENFGNLGVKLLRTFTAQAEALAKLQRKGEQVVRVVHVHNYPGGQVMAGDVHNHPRGGGRGQPTENGGQSDATGDFGQGAALPRPNEIGEGMPVARSRRAKKV